MSKPEPLEFEYFPTRADRDSKYEGSWDCEMWDPRIERPCWIQYSVVFFK